MFGLAASLPMKYTNAIVFGNVSNRPADVLVLVTTKGCMSAFVQEKSYSIIDMSGMLSHNVLSTFFSVLLL